MNCYKTDMSPNKDKTGKIIKEREHRPHQNKYAQQVDGTNAEPQLEQTEQDAEYKTYTENIYSAIFAREVIFDAGKSHAERFEAFRALGAGNDYRENLKVLGRFLTEENLKQRPRLYRNHVFDALSAMMEIAIYGVDSNRTNAEEKQILLKAVQNQFINNARAVQAALWENARDETKRNKAEAYLAILRKMTENTRTLDNVAAALMKYWEIENPKKTLIDDPLPQNGTRLSYSKFILNLRRLKINISLGANGTDGKKPLLLLKRPAR